MRSASMRRMYVPPLVGNDLHALEDLHVIFGSIVLAFLMHLVANLEDLHVILVSVVLMHLTRRKETKARTHCLHHGI